MPFIELQAHLKQALAEIGLESSEVDAETRFIMRFLGFSRLDELRAGSREITPDIWQRANAVLQRRARREPLQYILGTQDFYGLELEVSPAVLIPRPETEELVTLVYSHLPTQGELTIADLGTGSGAIALALAHMLQQAGRNYTLWASDLSEAALALAVRNGLKYGLNNRIVWLSGHGLEPFLQQGLKLDALVSNPPYIPLVVWRQLAPEVRDFEPQMALTPGQDALYFYRLLAEQGPGLLKSGGWLCVELDADQAEQTARLFQSEAWQEVALKPDFNGLNRFLCALRV